MEIMIIVTLTFLMRKKKREKRQKTGSWGKV